MFSDGAFSQLSGSVVVGWSTGSWTDDEDKKLVARVAQGAKDWGSIAECIYGRT